MGGELLAQRPIEVILLRQWASYIAVPMWITDDVGNLIYFNEPAEAILGKRFDEVGTIHAEDVADIFLTTDLDGNPLDSKQLPIFRALTEGTPAHSQIKFQAFDGSFRTIEVTALPIEGQGGRHLGVMAMFWEHNGE